jgi:uncharacterized protein
LANVNDWLLDTGPLVAYFSPRDRAHQLCVETLDNFSGGLITTSAVIAEAMYFATENINGPALLLEFLEASSVEVIECCQPDDLRRAVSLMAKYTDTPMDFADATLVLLADELRQYDICTLDRRGFRTFRTEKGKGFNLVIDGI